MTFKDALSSVGQPDKAGRGLWGPYYEYWQPNGSVRISFETIESGTTGAKFSKWRLKAFPREGPIDAILDPILRERLNRPFRNQAELVIMAPNGGHPTINIMIRDNQVHSIEWLSD